MAVSPVYSIVLWLEPEASQRIHRWSYGLAFNPLINARAASLFIFFFLSSSCLITGKISIGHAWAVKCYARWRFSSLLPSTNRPRPIRTKL